MSPIRIQMATPADKTHWLRMRQQLWPGHDAQEHLQEMDAILAKSTDQPVFLAFREDGTPCGFLEGGKRKYAEGCETSPVGYIEGWYVDMDVRRMGVGTALVEAMEHWARKHGLAEMGSDTWLDNQVSITAHTQLGYTEVERLAHFAKKL